MKFCIPLLTHIHFMSQTVQGPPQLPSNDSNAYCSGNIVPKSFTEHY